MADKNESFEGLNIENIDELKGETCYLIDEEDKEIPFEIVAGLRIDGAEYFAFMPLEGDECEYVILKKERDEDGEDVYATIEDDDEFEKVADIFEDKVFAEFDLDDLGDESDED